jgi:hypothetical protein
MKKQCIFIFLLLIKFLALPSQFFTEDVAQLVRASVCGTEGRGFEPHLPPLIHQSICQREFIFPDFFPLRNVVSDPTSDTIFLSTYIRNSDKNL